MSPAVLLAFASSVDDGLGDDLVMSCLHRCCLHCCLPRHCSQWLFAAK